MYQKVKEMDLICGWREKSEIYLWILGSRVKTPIHIWIQLKDHQYTVHFLMGVKNFLNFFVTTIHLVGVCFCWLRAKFEC